MDNPRVALAASPVAVMVALLLALAGSQHGLAIGAVPAFALAVAAAFVIQWVAFVPSLLARTEHYFDLIGALTYIAATLGLVLLTPGVDARGLLLAAMVLVWAARLGGFLFLRARRAGGDDRFDDIKTDPLRFFNVWTVQALWVSMTAAGAWIAITSSVRVGLDALALIGTLVWLAGFGFEVIADVQKSRFKADPSQAGRFIKVGLWSWSRHPNYFGEIVAWIGVTLVALPTFTGWGWVGLISPVFVTLLLTRVSGIPLLEAKAERRWGDQPDYQGYRRTTPVLIPRPPSPAA